uniref:Uncharacterized protein n=1 Tax=Arundo donax TaxID=35708 RepID=A0A0A9G5Q1_ARUDO
MVSFHSCFTAATPVLASPALPCRSRCPNGTASRRRYPVC